MTAPAEDRHVELLVWRADGSLHGCARDRAGHRREFTGWLGLSAVLDGLLDDLETTHTEDA
jgi:hypothetical protein